MQGRVLSLLTVLLLVVGAGLPRAASSEGLETSFHSSALEGALHLAVVLPPGYGTSRLRYPVIYFLHGLPASAVAYRGLASIRRALAAFGGRAILVGPQGARDADTDPEYLDRGAGREWERALALELPRFVDRRFRTIATRRGRALIGVSAGGYGAIALGLHHLATFSVVESWSGYFHPTDPSGWNTLDLGSPRANAHASAHSLVPALRATFSRRPTFLGFFVGRGDARFRSENERLHRELTAARVPHLFRLYPGGHDQRLWQLRAPSWLRLALGHLSRPRSGVS